MPLPDLHVIAFGEAALLAEVDGPDDAQRLDAELGRRNAAWLRATVPALASVLVEFDPLAVGAEAVREAIADAARSAPRSSRHARTRTIPIVYGGEHGPDLDDVARLVGLSPDEVAARHGATPLRVLFDGFAPGFAYLGDLSAELDVPRLATPRVRTPSGSVGIAGRMSGIYPAELPGGWRIVGRTPAALFDAHRDPPAYLVPGDTVRFERIHPADWDRYAGAPADW